ncbi:MAG: flagellar hook capping FlgD N-terminal domain-containing protein [Planctomycetota bacterium]
MDAVSAGTTAGALSTDALAPVDRGFGSLDSDEFTRIILTELGNQDPLEPSDTSALLEQLSTIRSIESDTELNETLAQLADRSDFTAAAGLIGMNVTTSGDGSTQRTVASVGQNGDGVSVTLDNGSIVPLTSVTGVFGTADVAGSGAGS